MKQDVRTLKRKRNQEGGSSNGGLPYAINGPGVTVAEAEACKGIYHAVMDVPGFSRDELMCS